MGSKVWRVGNGTVANRAVANRFWFRFVIGYQDHVELRRFDDLKAILRRDFGTVAGFALERYFVWKFTEESHCVKMGGWWDGKGENEIDLVCSKGSRIDFFEVKRDTRRISLPQLKRKTEVFLAKNPHLRGGGYRCRALSLKDMCGTSPNGHPWPRHGGGRLKRRGPPCKRGTELAHAEPQ